MRQPIDSDFKNLGNDNQSLKVVYNKYYPKIFNFLKRRAWPDVALALDMTSETFLKMINNIEQYEHRSESKFSSWLFTIAYNSLMEYYRREKKFDYLPNSELEVIKGYDVPTSEIKEIEEDFIKNEEVKSLQEAIKNLDVKYQVVIDLYYFEQKSYEEISEITNIKLGTVKSRLSRAKKKIQRIMEQNPN